MAQHQERLSKNKISATAANAIGGVAAIQLKDNRKLSVVQEKLHQNNVPAQLGHTPVQKKASHAVPSDKTVQLKVLPNRKGGGFKSTLTGQVYPTEIAAQNAERAHEEERARMEQEEQPEVEYEFQPPQQGAPVLPQTPIAEALLQHPVHFGSVMTTGGDVTAGQANALAGSQVIPQGQRTAFSARNTHAMVLSEGLDGIHVHSHAGQSTPVSSISYASHPVPQFYQNHGFMQGAPPEHVTLPDDRKSAHAEALAAHSEAFRSSVQRNAEDMNVMAEEMGFDPELGVGDESEEQFQNTVSFLSGLPVSSNIAINRASCGHHGKSGHTGGCNQEMAETGEHYPEMLEDHMDPQLAFLATQTGMASFGVSASGPYKHQGNPALMTQSGVNVSMHNSFNWNTGQPKPISEKQQEYEARSKTDAKRKKKVKGESSSHSFHPYRKDDKPPPPPPSGEGVFA
ncbi:hypothetical protein [Flavobacterium sp. FlaQc-48]|uniref:hypothetical protein n=1 Tax=Flavobacterium sp. FlaQc-48 TaxID=3374181 RepID=UPI003756DABA